MYKWVAILSYIDKQKNCLLQGKSSVSLNILQEVFFFKSDKSSFSPEPKKELLKKNIS